MGTSQRTPEVTVAESTEREIPVNFSSFVISLASSAMVNLGEMPDPVSRERSMDLDLARQTIDLLGVLQDKTKGNLDDEEAQLMESVLYDLRMKFLNKREGTQDD